jgi:spermidine synthase
VCMVELDARVTDLCSRYLSWDKGALLDPRVHVFFEDAALLLPKIATTRQFDVAIVDSTQPVDGSVAGPLMQVSFLETLGSLLRPGGLIAGYGVNAAPVGQSIRRQIRGRTLQVLAGDLIEYVVPCPFYSASFAHQIWSSNTSNLQDRIISAFASFSVASDCAMDVRSLVSYLSVAWDYRLAA